MMGLVSGRSKLQAGPATRPDFSRLLPDRRRWSSDHIYWRSPDTREKQVSLARIPAEFSYWLSAAIVMSFTNILCAANANTNEIW